MGHVVFPELSQFMTSGGRSEREARKRLPAPQDELLEQIDDRLPRGYQLDHLLGIDGATQHYALGLRVTRPDRASIAMLFWLNSARGRPLMWISDLMAFDTGQGDGSALMLTVTDAVIPALQPRVIALNAQGCGLHYWPRSFQTMPPQQRAEWHTTHCLPFANANRDALDADDYELLCDQQVPLSVLAALTAPDPLGDYKTLGHSLFMTGPDFSCYTPVTPGMLQGMRHTYQRHVKQAAAHAPGRQAPDITPPKRALVR